MEFFSPWAAAKCAPVENRPLIALLQRVIKANVCISGTEIAQIGQGLLVLLAVQPTDTPESASLLLDRMLDYRVFADDAGKMNLSLRTIAGGLLLVPQFTLAADTRRGLRPGFASAAPPAQARSLFEALTAMARTRHPRVACGRFGADMQVSLVNDGPVTFWLEN